MDFYFRCKNKEFQKGDDACSWIVLLSNDRLIHYASNKSKDQLYEYDPQQLSFFRMPSGLSDGGRILSIEKGMELFRDHILTGVWDWRFKGGMKRKLTQLPSIRKMFCCRTIKICFCLAAGTGIFGLIVFTIAVYSHSCESRYFKNWLLCVFTSCVYRHSLQLLPLKNKWRTGFYLSYFALM